MKNEKQADLSNFQRSEVVESHKKFLTDFNSIWRSDNFLLIISLLNTSIQVILSSP